MSEQATTTTPVARQMDAVTNDLHSIYRVLAKQSPITDDMRVVNRAIRGCLADLRGLSRNVAEMESGEPDDQVVTATTAAAA
jgi:hypothetical protein